MPARYPRQNVPRPDLFAAGGNNILNAIKERDNDTIIYRHMRNIFSFYFFIFLLMHLYAFMRCEIVTFY